MAVVEEWTTERDRYTLWLHRAVQGRVAGPLVQLRFISLISQQRPVWSGGPDLYYTLRGFK